MRRSGSAAAILVICLGIDLLARICHADSPLPPPAKKTIWSANRRYLAEMDPDKQITTIYRAKEGVRGEKVWAMYGWFRVASLADDGDHFVAGYAGVNLLPLDYKKQDVMVYFFRRGSLVNHVTLDQIIRDTSKLQRTVSHYMWGICDGIDDAGLYVIETVEGRSIRFSVATGLPASEGGPRHLQAPPEKAFESRP